MTLRYARALSRARPETRAHTHTLRLDHHAVGLDYSSCGPQWLAELLRRLPNAQAVLVQAHPWFDHGACLALRSAVFASQPERPFPVRLLTVKRCPNVLPSSLSTLLVACPAVVCLDLTYTRVGGDTGLATALGFLRDLRVLKLRGTGLVDDRLIELTAVLRMRLKSLDVAQNGLTDRSVDALLEHCFPRKISSSAATTSRFGRLHLSSLQTDRQASHGELYSTLTSRTVSRVQPEREGETGLTDLAMSDTVITAAGAAKLLQHPGLRSLDVGSTFDIGCTFRTPLSRPVRPPTQTVVLVKSLQRFTHLRLPWDMLLDFARETWEESSERSSAGVPHDITVTSKLHVLTLAGIPSHSVSRTPIDTICGLIRRFALQDRRARLDYTLPPGTTHDSARVLVLEVADYAPGRAPVGSSSVTGDADASTFWSAGQADFSFFDDDKPGALSQQRAATPSSFIQRQPMYDVVAEIAAFRQAAKAAFLPGDADSGHWLGRVEVRRPPKPG